MNEVGEVRMQFHVYSDSHEQMSAALEAFRGTTCSLGLPPVRLFYTDNPAGDKQYFMRMLPSLRAQQDEFDALVSQSETRHTVPDVGSDISLPPYPFANISSVRVASTKPEIEHLIMALKDDMTGDKIGLDAEWNVTKNSIGMQTGVSKVQLIQIAYRDSEGKVVVLLLRVGRLKQLPSCLDSLLGNTSRLGILGANVSADLTKIAKDFNSVDMKKVDQKSRENVHNLGLVARKRDVVQDGCASLQRIVECVLNHSLNKTLQCSDWSGVLTEDQIKYAAIDAAVSLEAGEKLLTMPDLTRRLLPEEVTPHRKVDIIPRHGNAACMATRAATATIHESVQCACPPGMIYVYRKKEHKTVKAGKGSCVVVINNIYSPALIIPNYKWEDRKRTGDVTLADFSVDQKILLPISMIKAHVDSARVRPTPIVQYDDTVGRSQPASRDNSMDNEEPKRQKPSSQHDSAVDEGLFDDDLSVDSNDVPDFDDDEEEYYKDENEQSIGITAGQLSESDIAFLQKTLFDGESVRSGRKVLLSPHLSHPPDPTEMRDKFSAVMGDVFHAMDRTKIPHQHEAKKAYFVALREAFFVWNQSKLKQLEERMVESGYTIEEVRRRKYFNSELFRGCVDRHLPAPTILYWRVRAVYVMYGSMKDSKTQAPLFNDRAWKKADNVLKEILEGYYSDPPRFAMYTKRLRSDGTVMTNSFGMEMIECKRGTNRTEGYHKNIITSFGTWHVGMEMSDCLLRERRHRHNMMVSMRRRLGFPRTGHYDIWLLEIYQVLVMKNHGLRIYPELGNTSDYKITNESFDTIPLHSQGLAEAVQRRYNELDVSQISLTADQKYLCRAMGTPLPFLPFSGEIEKKAFSAFVMQKQDLTSIDDDNAAMQWCELVDGKEIKPKLPSHMRTHLANWERNQRIKEHEAREAGKNDLLMELNKKMAPVYDFDSSNAMEENRETEVCIDGNNNGSNSNMQTSVPSMGVPPRQLWQLSPIIPAGMFFPMPPQAIVHNVQNMIVGGICVSAPQVVNPIRVSRGRGRPKNSNDTKARGKRSCGRCRDNAERGGEKTMYICKGKGGDGRVGCEYFDDNNNNRCGGINGNGRISVP